MIQYASHSLSYGSWSSYSDTQHRRTGSCTTCSYSTTDYGSHTFSYCGESDPHEICGDRCCAGIRDFESPAKKEIELAKIKLDQANSHLAEKQKDLSDYKTETLKVIRGQSNLSVELLNALVKETETMIALAQTHVGAAQTEYESLLASAENLRQEYDRLLTWADLFDTCSFEAKKMIVAQFVKAVRVSRDYNIEIDFNVSFEEFQNFSVKNGEPVILQPLRSHTA